MHDRIDCLISVHIGSGRRKVLVTMDLTEGGMASVDVRGVVEHGFCEKQYPSD